MHSRSSRRSESTSARASVLVVGHKVLPAAEPFKGHDGEVSKVALSPDGTRIVSGGKDGIVRLWTLDGKVAAEPFTMKTVNV
jgi:WD40 repeat protein